MTTSLPQLGASSLSMRARPDQTCTMTERRVETRTVLRLPLEVEGVGTAVTRDVSPGGLYLYVPNGLRFVGPLVFEVDFCEAGLGARARAGVVRIEPGELRTGLALRLRDLELTPVASRRRVRRR